MLALPWTGQSSPAQIYYTGAGCTGTAYLNGGWSGEHIHARTVVWSGSFNSWMVPAADTLVGGTSAPVESVSVASIDNPTCLGSATGRGYKLSPALGRGRGPARLDREPAVDPVVHIRG